ncbi:MAG TPA: sigma-54 dependent transcriptional regulator [Pyrinomonadaceae bacterium]
MLDSFISSSKRMNELREYIPKVARSDANVLIVGETGTGKERVAELIHYASQRSTEPFVCINCAALPESLIESELFGFERGAFTGAQDGYLGKMRLAAGGTIFLDEIGDLSLAAQAKLLRAIESREVFPLGGRRVVTINARFIAAVNRDLEPLIAEQKFRSDLFYRLNVARIFLPPLKDRKEDIPQLLFYFLDQFNQKLSERVGRPSQELLQLLMSYEWPGNIRELRNLVEALFIDPPRGPIAFEDLPESFRQILAGYVVETVPEKDRLVSTLSETNWNKSKAAAQLNWSRMTLYRKLAKYKITQPALGLSTSE